MGVELSPKEEPTVRTESALSSRSGTELLGLVWIDSPFPTLSLGLREAIKTDARVHCGREAPPEAPSSIIYCPDGEDIGKEVRRLQALLPDVPILIFGLSIDLQLARIALCAGASGLIHAAMQPSEIVRSLSLASKGDFVVPRELLKDLVVETTSAVDLAALTPRQREILALVSEGLTNAEVAKRLFLSEFTVKQHLRLAYKHLNVRNRIEAVKLYNLSIREAASRTA